MTLEESKAAAWAVKLLDSFLSLTGLELHADSRVQFETLRTMAKGGRR